LHLKARESEAAWQDYGDFLNAGGEDVPPTAWLELCRLAEVRKDYERAVSDYEKLANAHALAREALLARISAARICLKRLSRPHDALRFYEEASASAISHLDLQQNIESGVRETRNALSQNKALSADAASGK
jgi:tetratricopeptide (TPR) repeat protein